MTRENDSSQIQCTSDLSYCLLFDRRGIWSGLTRADLTELVLCVGTVIKFDEWQGLDCEAGASIQIWNDDWGKCEGNAGYRIRIDDRDVAKGLDVKDLAGITFSICTALRIGDDRTEFTLSSGIEWVMAETERGVPVAKSWVGSLLSTLSEGIGNGDDTDALDADD